MAGTVEPDFARRARLMKECLVGYFNVFPFGPLQGEPLPMEEASALNLEEGATVYKYLEALLRKIRKETLRVYILTAEETKFVFENTDRISGCGKEYASRIHQLVAEITEAIDCYVDLRRKTAHKDLPPASGLRPMGLFEHFMHNVSLDLKNQLLVQAVATNPQFVTELVARMPEPMQSE